LLYIGKEGSRTPRERVTLNYKALLDSDDVDDDVLWYVLLTYRYQEFYVEKHSLSY
jgi:hypothetical protein